MKLRTRLVSLFSSAIIALMSVTSINSFAATDPNGDGKLDISDAVYIRQYLLGVFNTPNLNNLDFDENGIISSLDVEKIQLTLLGKLNDTVVNEVVNESSISNSYYVYDAKSGNYLRNYSLSHKYYNSSVSMMESSEMESYNAPGLAGTNNIIGTDDREENYSNRFAVKIFNEVGACSGFVVAPHIVATAAHCVFQVIPYYINRLIVFDNGVPQDVTPVEYHVPAAFINGNNRNLDYALITVKEDLSQYLESPDYKYELGTITDLASTPDHKLEVHTVGFPGLLNPGTSSEKEINNWNEHSERVSSGLIRSFSDNVIYYTADASAGNSGGAIYTIEKFDNVERRVVIGLHSGSPEKDKTCNAGTRFTARELKFYNSNPNLKW